MVSSNQINKICFSNIMSINYSSKNFVKDYSIIVKKYCQEHKERFNKFCFFHDYNVYDKIEVAVIDVETIEGHFFFKENHKILLKFRENIVQAQIYLESDDSEYYKNDDPYTLCRIWIACTLATESYNSK